MDDDPGAIHEDVPFDGDGADALIRAFEQMAQEIDDQRSARLTAGARALDRWQGQAVPLFLQRRTTGDADAGELVARLRAAADDVRTLARAADREQARRAAASDRDEIDESLWDDVTVTAVTAVVGDVGDEDIEPPPLPPRPPPPAEPHLSSPSGTAQERA